MKKRLLRFKIGGFGIVFNRFVNYFYGEGVGLRQICDWCRLLWTFRGELDLKQLESRIRRAGLMMEWKSFGAFAVDYLGMPVEAMPFCEDAASLHRKAERICRLVMEAGNFGQNKDESYRRRYPKVVGYIITFWRRLREFAGIAAVFPLNTPRFFVTYVVDRVRAAIMG